MKIFLALPLIVALAGCQSFSNLTPAQTASLTCLGTAAGAAVAANHTDPVKAAIIQSDGSVLCKFATGASLVVVTK